MGSPVALLEVLFVEGPANSTPMVVAMVVSGTCRRPLRKSPLRNAPSQRYCLITPCRNEAEYIRKALETTTAQTVPPTRWLGVDAESFAYPYGMRPDHSPDTARVLAELGYTSIFVALHGAMRRGTDPLNLPRIKVEGGEPSRCSSCYVAAPSTSGACSTRPATGCSAPLPRVRADRNRIADPSPDLRA